MILFSFLLACGGQEAQLEAEVERLETEVGRLQAEIAGLRKSNQHLEMLEAASSAANEPITGKCVELDDGRYRVPEELLAQMQARPEALVREGRWIPSAKGDVQAWRAVHVRRGSVLASCGIRNGDVLRSVNDSNTPSNWLDVLEGASDLGRAVIDIRRGGDSLSLEYTLE